MKQEENSIGVPGPKASFTDESCYSISHKNTLITQGISSNSETALDKVTQCLYQDGIWQKKRKNARILKTRKVAVHPEPLHSKNESRCDNGPRGILEKNRELFNCLHEDSKHKRELGLKKREAIAQAIQERREVKVLKNEKISVAKASDYYYREMEKMNLKEQKKVELARARGVPFIARYIKI